MRAQGRQADDWRWKYALVLAACAAALVARSPELIFAPRLVMEDGAFFFTQAYSLPATVSLITPYAGYWHLVPRIVAEVGTLLPARDAPLLYSLVTLGLTSVAVSWFYLPHFRPMVAHDGLRLAFVALVVFMPGLDGLLLLAYVQWYLALWGVLFVLMEPPRRLWVQWVLTAVYVVALGTSPALHLLLPVWVWRLFAAKRREQRLWLLTIVIGSLVMLLLTLYGPAKSSLALGDPTALFLDLARGAAFRVVATPLLGYPLAQEILRQWGWPPLLGAAAVVLLSVAAGSLGWLDKRRRPAVLILLYTAGTAYALYLIRSQTYGAPFLNADNQVPLLNVRYFLLGIVALYLLLLMLADQWLAADRSRAGWLYSLLLIVLLLYSPTVRWAEWPDANWPRYAWLLEHVIAEDSVRWSPNYPQPPGDSPPAASGPVFVYIPLSPLDWTMQLRLPSDQPRGYLFPEGLRLLAAHTESRGSSVHVDLDWNVNAADVPVSSYTVYVHLLGPDGARVSGSDVPAWDEEEPPAPHTVWITHHELPLAAALPPGDYDLAVGLYTWDGGQIAPGSAVVLPQWVHAP